MKAKIKATGKIVDVYKSCNEVFPWCNSTGDILWKTENLDFDIESDYWEKLLHQYAGMAMQGYIIAAHLSHFSFCESDMKDCVSMATALVREIKEKEERGC